MIKTAEGLLQCVLKPHNSSSLFGGGVCGACILLTAQDFYTSSGYYKDNNMASLKVE